MNLEGKLLGSRYEIIEKIGNGGMATVYKAKDLVLKRYVAVKILREEYTTDNEFIKRFNTEAESAASLTHPNIVSVYDLSLIHIYEFDNKTYKTEISRLKKASSQEVKKMLEK